MILAQINNLAFKIIHKINLECYSTPIQNNVLTIFLSNNDTVKVPLNINQLQSFQRR